MTDQPQTRLEGKTVLITGAAGFIVNGWWHGAVPSAALNVVWMMIGGVALWRIWAKRGSSTSVT